MQLGLARARWDLVCGRAVEDGERRLAANDLVISLQNARDLDGALPLAEEALVVERRINGDDDPSTLSCISSLASLHGDMGNHDQALPLHTEALAGSRRVRGDDHPSTLGSISNIGYLHFVMGNHDLALPLCEEALAGRRRVLGSAHPDTLASSSNMAMIALDVKVILTPPCVFHK